MRKEPCENCDGVEVEEYVDGFGFSHGFICDDCMTSRSERNYEKQFSDYHSGQGSLSVEEQYLKARFEKYGI